MSKQKPIPTGSARERILQIASELFYQQGFRATGINEVIEKSGVAKATFYKQFPSKDDLGVNYLQELHKAEMVVLDKAIREAKGPTEKFLSILASLEPWLIKTRFRGCPYLNMASEIPDPRSPLRKEGVRLYDTIHSRIENLTEELINSNSKNYGHLDTTEISNIYMVQFSGAIALAELYNAIWPVESALITMRKLIGK